MDKALYELLSANRDKEELAAVNSCNEIIGRQFGLSLTREEAAALIAAKQESLKKHQRVEFGRGILDKLMFVFCDSQYISRQDYAETLARLQDIFYVFKNEAQDRLTDEELLTFMKEQFETVCFRDMEYLEGTCLTRFSAAVRAGYRGYEAFGGKGEYEELSEEQRWDSELYTEALRELFWE
ncbi:DUF6323 family protein [Dorea sp. D27]|uniref:DUF6323 family protein n=1 Tax=Dorea sp. D27 TaxID=658665 RepID=UPI0006739655|nr:DUF6323 family protein [Dorea sp. D27]KMZ55027.1 hypothetical protein HMPREF0980_01023 [Dorea sp. D27]